MCMMMRPFSGKLHNGCAVRSHNGSGTINGYGERCGNVDLLAVTGNLQLKMGYECIPGENLKH